MRRARIGVIAAALGAGALGAGTASANLTIDVVNESGQPDSDVYVTLLCGAANKDGSRACANGGTGNGGAMLENTPTPLSKIPGGRITIGSPYPSGNVFIGYGNGIKEGRKNEPPVPLENVANATTPTRWGVMEFTLGGQGDLQAIDQLGVPLRMDVENMANTSLGWRGFVCDLNSTRSLLASIPGSAGGLRTDGDRFVRYIGPSKLGIPGNPPQSYPALDDYIITLVGTTISIETGRAFGGLTTFRGTVAQGSGAPTVTLNDVVGAKKSLEVELTSQQIYAANGPYKVGGVTVPQVANDLHGEVYNRIVSGFAFGYWGGRFGNRVDDDGTGSGWWRQPAFMKARSGPAPFRSPNPQYSSYAYVIDLVSDHRIYGHPFSDALPQDPGALIDVPDGGTITLTVQPDELPAGSEPAFCNSPPERITRATAAPRPTCLGARATHVGSRRDDVISGTPQPDVIVAGAGADKIRSLGGEDIVCAGDGADSVVAGRGDDTVLGQRGPDMLLGQAGRDVVVGHEDPDMIRGGVGNDVLLGGAGPDVLSGDPGDDRLGGGLGNDTLRGGPGRDRGVGGLGSDRFLSIETIFP